MAVAVLLLAILALFGRTRRIDGRLRALTRRDEAGSLDAGLDGSVRLESLAHGLDGLAARTAVLEATQRKAASPIGWPKRSLMALK